MHFKKNKLSLFCTLLFLLIQLSSLAQQTNNFDDHWKFNFGNASDPSKDFKYGVANIFSKSGGAFETAIDPNFVDSNWTTLNLPHDWAIEVPFANHANFDVESHGFRKVGGLFPETSIGWYRKHFKVAKSDSGNSFQLQFDGIFRNATIWVNGIYTGNNLSGYLGVNYDITDFINYERENVITVRVDATQYEGWFYEGAGIYRHVWFKKLNNLHIVNDGVFVYANIKGKDAVVNVETNIENKNFNAANGILQTYLTDRNGNKIASAAPQNLILSSRTDQHYKQTLSLKNPHVWNLDSPYLYRVVSEIKIGDKIIDQQIHRFGVRSLRFDANEGFFLNGNHIKIKGTNNHQDHAGIGSALPDAMQYYRIDLLKKMGSNAYRTSHNAPTPELLDACDSLGMLVLDEQRLLNSSNEYIVQLERLIKRDRNHPSVFLWSIGNEEGWIQTTAIGKRIAQTLLAKQIELDPTRTSTYAADLPNYFKGVNEVIPIRGFNYRHDAVAAYHRDHPKQPIIGTEMGSTVTTRGIYEKDSIKAYVPDQDIIAPWWASRAEAWWKVAAVNNYWIGGFVWTGFDYRGEPTPYKWPNISSHFGIMDVCGFPKNIYYYYQSWWTDKDVLHISPHWNWKGKEGKPIDVWVNTNADNVELFLNGKSLGKKEMPRNSHLQWWVNYEPGKLEAIAYKKGKKITSFVETTKDAANLLLEPNKTHLLADGKDISIINITVVDKDGCEVPDANKMIDFKLFGDAKIIGVGNGDPSSHQADFCKDGKWQRSSFNGKCQVIIQSGKTKGKHRFEALLDGLYLSSLDLESQ
ncbi:MAG: beta-galactosidase GalA [Bacteroidota bacterium]